jgi:hypothetical protein
MRTITKTQFRVLLTLSILASIASVLAGVVADRWLLPQALRDYLEAYRAYRAQGPKLRDVIVGIFALPGMVALIIAVIGLYRFWPRARWLAVASWAYVLVWMPFSSGPVVANNLDGALSQCSTLLAGVVLGVAYFSPAADWFRNNGLPNPQGGASGRQPSSSEANSTSAAAAPPAHPEC